MHLVIDNKRFSDSQTGILQEKKSTERRISLVTIFSASFFSMLVLFILVNSIIVLRLSDFQSILSQLSNNVLPKVTLSGEAFSKVNQLTYLTARLSSSPSQAFRLIAYRDIEVKINEISDLKLIASDDQILRTQLDSIVNEFEGLNLLIEKRIQLQRQVKLQESSMYTLHSDVMELPTIASKSSEYQRNFDWILDFSELVTLSARSLAVRRLNQVRRFGKEIKKKIERLKDQSKGIVFSNKMSASEAANQLESMLVLDDGLIPTRIQELRSIGQAIGRSNFVHNLVVDFSRQVQFESHDLNEVIINDAKATAIKIKVESDLIKVVAVFSIIFLSGVVYYLQRRIIKRLVILNYGVQDKIEGKDLNLDISGNDEISDIAQSFDLLVDEIEEQKSKLQKLSLTDGLTGIANRRYLDKHLDAQLEIAKKNKLPLSVLMMDVDYFKNFNDHYGHLAGDDCLKKIAEAFKKSIQRKTDFVARFGGEEFLLVLPDTTSEGAEKIAQEMLHGVISMKITHEWNMASPYVTLSVGHATFRPNSSIDDNELLKRADEALFRAKEKGKNCSVAFDIS